MNYDIDDDLHQRAKVAAAQAGITFKAWIEQAIQAAVEAHEKKDQDRRPRQR